MRLLYISDLFPPNDKGGAEVVAYNEARAMAASGHDVFVATVSPDKGFHVRQDEGIRVYEFPTLLSFLPAALSRFYLAVRLLLSLIEPVALKHISRILSETRPDLVHAHCIGTIPFGVLRLVKWRGIKLVQTYHSYHYQCPKGALLRKRTTGGSFTACYQPIPALCKLWIWLYKHIMPKPDAILAISTFSMERLEKEGFQNIKYLPNGIVFWNKASSAVGHQQVNQLRDSSRKVILSIGRLNAEKGVHLLLEAYARSTIAQTSAKLVIAGDGPQAPVLMSMAKEAGGEVVFTGRIPRDAVAELYAQSDIVVLPTLCYEVLNTVAIEAAVAGKPVIASDVPGVRDSVADGVTGMLFPMGDVEALREKLESMLKDENLIARMGAAGREKARAFSMERHVDELQRIYACLFGDKR